jgi:NADH-quinone oxidoreductase subunit A
MDFFFVLLFIFLTAIFVFGALFASRLIAPHHPNPLKNSPYECGEKPMGSAFMQFHVGYYLLALIFLIFDVEAAFLYPWATVLRELGTLGLIEAGVFVFILLLGLIYAWKKGVLEWE